MSDKLTTWVKSPPITIFFVGGGLNYYSLCIWHTSLNLALMPAIGDVIVGNNNDRAYRLYGLPLACENQLKTCHFLLNLLLDNFQWSNYLLTTRGGLNLSPQKTDDLFFA